MADEESFLHRKHLIGASWALFVALVSSVATFVATVAYQHSQGPQRVVVANQLPVTFASRDSVADAALKQLIDEVQALQAIEVRASGFRLRGEARRADTLANVLGAVGDARQTVNSLLESPFSLPPISKGYEQTSLTTIAIAQCPLIEAKAGSYLLARFRFTDARIVPRVTPIFVMVDRPISASRVDEVSQQQFQTQVSNLLIVRAPIAPGTYSLRFGVFFNDSLSVPYPKFFSAGCSLHLTA